MKSTYTFLFFFAFNLLIVALAKSKYDKESNTANNNDSGIKRDRPFRTNKVNLVWEKAQKRVTDPDELKELMLDLKVQDKLELGVKKRRAEGLDEDGEYEAVVRTKLLEITEKYEIDDKWIDASNKIPEFDKRAVHERSHKDQGSARKVDKKLEKLYKKAQAAGFDSYELEQLQNELDHHRQKMDEFNQLQAQIEEMDISDNEIDGKRKKKTVKNELKQKHKEIKKNYKNLEDTVRNKNGSIKTEFSEPKVVELWLMAKKANFTEVELESLKGELRHFEAKVKKHEHYVDLVGQDVNRKPNKHNSAEEEDLNKRKADEMARKVKKYHNELKTRIMAHTEL